MTQIPPEYASWEDYLERVPLKSILEWCSRKARRANRARLMSGLPDVRITADDVLLVLERAQGRCDYCGSLAVEGRPSAGKGAPAPWEAVGRRIGSLSHVVERFYGGSNHPDNLGWACLWCNDHAEARIPGATDRGGHHPRRTRFGPIPDPDRSRRIEASRRRCAAIDARLAERQMDAELEAELAREDDRFYYLDSPREIPIDL
ncbi:MAG: HNH endonuclease [Candidatus Nanopelagicales bacterium]